MVLDNLINWAILQVIEPIQSYSDEYYIKNIKRKAA